MKALNLILITLTSVILMGCQVELSELTSEDATQATTSSESQADNTTENTTSNNTTTNNTSDNDDITETTASNDTTSDETATSDDTATDETTTNDDATTNETIISNGEVILYWSAPNQRVNGLTVDLSDIQGYEIRYKKSDDEEYTTILITDNLTDQLLIEGLDNASDYQFEIAAIDTYGIYSKYVTALAS